MRLWCNQLRRDIYISWFCVYTEWQYADTETSGCLLYEKCSLSTQNFGQTHVPHELHGVGPVCVSMTCLCTACLRYVYLQHATYAQHVIVHVFTCTCVQHEQSASLIVQKFLYSMSVNMCLQHNIIVISTSTACHNVYNYTCICSPTTCHFYNMFVTYLKATINCGY